MHIHVRTYFIIWLVCAAIEIFKCFVRHNLIGIQTLVVNEWVKERQNSLRFLMEITWPIMSQITMYIAKNKFWRGMKCVYNCVSLFLENRVHISVGIEVCLYPYFQHIKSGTCHSHKLSNLLWEYIHS